MGKMAQPSEACSASTLEPNRACWHRLLKGSPAVLQPARLRWRACASGLEVLAVATRRVTASERVHSASAQERNELVRSHAR